MINSLLYNSYHVLGLPVTATQRDILKRTNELQKLLKIDEVPSYDGDLLDPSKIRTEYSIKEALQNLSTPKKRIREYFFWFIENDAIDEKVFEELNSKSYESAIKIWRLAGAKSTTKAFFYKKNLALLYCVLLLNENLSNSSHLKNSLEIWKDLIDSDRFWATFRQYFKKHDDMNTSTEIIADFEKHVTSYLADIYTEISQKQNDNSFFTEFSTEFGVKGEKATSDIVNPIYNNIHSIVADIERIKITEITTDLDVKLKELKDGIHKIQIQLNTLIDLGLYEDSETKTIRDKAVTSIRSVILDIYNNNLDTNNKCLALFAITMKIAGSVGMEHKIQADINTIKNNEKYNTAINPITDLISEEKFKEAIDLINTQLPTSDKDLEKALLNQKKLAVTMFAFKKSQLGKEFIDSTQYDLAQQNFTEAGNFLFANLEVFDGLDPDGVKKILKQVSDMVALASSKSLSTIDEWKANLQKEVNEKFAEGDMDKYALSILIDCYMWGGLMPLFKRIRQNVQIANVCYVIGWFTVWFYGIGILFWIASYVIRNKD